MGAPDLYALRREHGGDVFDGGTRALFPGPGHSRRDRSLSAVVTAEGRLLLHSFANDSFPACAAYLGIEAKSAERVDRFAMDRMRRAREEARRKAEAEDRALCASVWAGTVPIEGSPAEAYLWSRGLILEGSPVVRFHPAAPREKKPNPDRPPMPPHAAMVAMAQKVSGEPMGLHLTFLTPDGCKAFGDRSRIMLGPMASGAVRLEPMTSEGVLAVAEGVETAGSFSILRSVPCWSCLSSSGLQNFALPRGLRRLLIAADGDNGGMTAAMGLAERARRSCDVEIHAAPEGRDWNNVLQEGQNG